MVHKFKKKKQLEKAKIVSLELEYLLISTRIEFKLLICMYMLAGNVHPSECISDIKLKLLS